MSFEKWNTPDNTPPKGHQFLAKIRGSNDLVLGKILSDLGWLVCTELSNNVSSSWDIYKEKIEYWFDVENI